MINAMLFFLVLQVGAMSYIGAPGHKETSHIVFEGVEGLDDVYKRVSSGIDHEFVKCFEETFGSRPAGNHRLLGHWGFGGSIPFGEEPYKTVLGRYPKEKVIELWQNYVTGLTQKTAEQTGLPLKQAKALTALIYDTHIICDYTGSELAALPSPVFLEKDVISCLQTLFGKRSEFVEGIAKEMAKIPADWTAVEKSDGALVVLAKADIGKQLDKTYGTVLRKHGVTYTYTPAKRALIESLTAKTHIVFQENILARSFFKGGRPLTLRQSVGYQKIVRGVMQEVTIKGRRVYILSLPFQPTAEERVASTLIKGFLTASESSGDVIDKEALMRVVGAKLQKVAVGDGCELSDEVARKITEQCYKWATASPTKAAMSAGILTFIFSEGGTVCKFATGEIDEPGFYKETGRNLGGAILSGSACYGAVVLGATPSGFIVMGLCVGTVVAWDFMFEKLDEEFSTPQISMSDVLGKLPTALQNRRDVWGVSARKMIDFQQMERRQSGFDVSNGNEKFESMGKKVSPFDLPSGVNVLSE